MVPTRTGKQGNPGDNFPVREKSEKIRNFDIGKNTEKSREICWPEKVGTMEMCMTTSIQENKFTVNWP